MSRSSERSQLAALSLESNPALASNSNKNPFPPAYGFRAISPSGPASKSCSCSIARRTRTTPILTTTLHRIPRRPEISYSHSRAWLQLAGHRGLYEVQAMVEIPQTRQCRSFPRATGRQHSGILRLLHCPGRLGAILYSKGAHALLESQCRGRAISDGACDRCACPARRIRVVERYECGQPRCESRI